MCERKEKDCKCYNAVMSAYASLSKSLPPQVALEAANRVYRFHHPEQPKVDAALLVDQWVNENRVQ